jgi:hypothetical protein
MAPQVEVELTDDYAALAGTAADIGIGYYLAAIVPKSDVNSGSYNTYQGVLFDAYGNVEREFSPTLKVKTDLLDTGVYQVQGSCGTCDHTYGFTSIINTNGNGVSIPTLTAITSFSGQRPTLPFVLTSAVDVCVENDGSIELMGPQNYQPLFKVKGNVPAFQSWSALFERAAGLAVGSDVNINFTPGEYIFILINFITKRHLAKR